MTNDNEHASRIEAQLRIAEEESESELKESTRSCPHCGEDQGRSGWVRHVRACREGQHE